MAMINRCIVGVGLMLLPLFAQRSGAPLPAEDPRLYILFFQFHDSLNAKVQEKKAQDPEAGAKAEKGVARLLRIEQKELQKVSDIAHRFVTDLANWQDELKAYADQARSQSQKPDVVVVRQFEQRKQQSIDTAVRHLSATLSPAGWAGLHAYINEEHRLHTTMVQLGPRP
jgi:hypothetical protein